MFEYAYNIYNSPKDLKTLFDNMINELNLINDYKKFEDHQQFIFCLLDNRLNFEKRLINENSKTNNAYHTLLRLLKQKNKHFEQDYINTFLEEQNLRVKEGKAFNINLWKKVIKISTNPKIKQKFKILIDEINRSTKPIPRQKPSLSIKTTETQLKSIYPTKPTFTMKIIASRGSGKTTFLIAFLNSLINKNIVKHENIYIFCPTFDYQNIRITSGFQRRNIDY